MKIRILPSLVRRLIGRKRRHIKIEKLGKLDGCMMFQSMCERHGVLFEKATEYSLFRDFKILKHRHAKRILVRTEDSRKEYVTDGVTKGRLEDISAEIRRFVHDKRFIVQEVGLREDISS
ncbi:hypothetical protein IIC68_02785, partial [archaeon]|nr:hypothetical protein [archaeon]